MAINDAPLSSDEVWQIVIHSSPSSVGGQVLFEWRFFVINVAGLVGFFDEHIEIDVGDPGYHVGVTVNTLGGASDRQFVSFSVLPWVNGERPRLRPRAEAADIVTINLTNSGLGGPGSGICLSSDLINFAYIIEEIWFFQTGANDGDMRIRPVVGTDIDTTFSAGMDVLSGAGIFGSILQGGIESMSDGNVNGGYLTAYNSSQLVRPWTNVRNVPSSIKIYVQSVADATVFVRFRLRRLSWLPWWKDPRYSFT